jgi:hypothetical protein
VPLATIELTIWPQPILVPRIPEPDLDLDPDLDPNQELCLLGDWSIGQFPYSGWGRIEHWAAIKITLFIFFFIFYFEIKNYHLRYAPLPPRGLCCPSELCGLLLDGLLSDDQLSDGRLSDGLLFDGL